MTDGGPAFPQSYRIPGCSTVTGCSGLSLRDYFAAAAIPPLCARWLDDDLVADWPAIADEAYRLADAMLEERNKEAAK